MILIDPLLELSPALAATSGAKLPSVRTLARFLAQAQAAARLRGEVTVLLANDAAMRDLNRRFRGKNKPTDVLSFPVSDHVQSEEKGDLAISVETALRQSAEQGHSLATELKVLMLHGVLHLAGYDHETDTGQMHRRERTLRARLGLPLGLIERTESQSASQQVSPSARGRRPARSPRI